MSASSIAYEYCHRLIHRIAENRQSRRNKKARRNTQYQTSGAICESLENRVLLSGDLAVAYVDDSWAALTVGVDPDADGPATAYGTDAFATIQEAIDNLQVAGTIHVADGTYNENLSITQNLTLLSDNGRDVTFINGISGVGALGTITLSDTTDVIRIGSSGKGFTIKGIDNGAPAQANAAVYIQGNHTDIIVYSNEIIANGDYGLYAAPGTSISNSAIIGNIFSGQTFIGDTPGGTGLAFENSVANVPRELLNIGNDTTSDDFSGNISANKFIGTTGGLNSLGMEQGNHLVSINSSNARLSMSSNTFDGTTMSRVASLFTIGTVPSLRYNHFNSQSMSQESLHILFSVTDKTPSESSIVSYNTFDRGAYINGLGGITVGLEFLFAVAPADSVVNILSGSYDADLTITNDNITVMGPNAGIAPDSPNRRSESTITGGFGVQADNFTLNGVTIEKGTKINGIGSDYGVYFDSLTSGHQISNNIITGLDGNSESGIFTYGTVSDTLIADNALSNWYYGIRLDDMTASQITDNNIAYSTIGILLNNDGVSQISGNTITDSSFLHMQLTADAGTLTVTDNTLQIVADKETAHVLTSGNIDITDSQLNLQLSGELQTGQTYKLFQQNGATAITGAFQGIAEGDTVTLTYDQEQYLAQLSYAGGDGNDITLDVLNIVSPVAQNVATSTNQNTNVTASFNATDDTDNSVLTYEIVDDIAANSGTLINNGDGTFTFNPNGDFDDLSQDQQQAVTFTYKATNQYNLESNVATVTITVTGINDLPVATSSDITTDEETAITANFTGSDIDQQDTLIYTIIDNHTTGAVTNNNDGTFTFNPVDVFSHLQVGESDIVTFTYLATDNHNGQSQLATVTVTVNGLANNISNAYVDDDWAALPMGVDPDGDGPATAMGHDAFATIQKAIDNAASNGTVHVSDGTYSENITTGNAITLSGNFTLDGTLNIVEQTKLEPGNSPGTINTGDIYLGSHGPTLDNIQLDFPHTSTIIRKTSTSNDGRYVTFSLSSPTYSTYENVYFYDAVTQTTTTISTGPNGVASNGDSTNPQISADGSYIVFQSTATNFADGINTQYQQIYGYDVQSGTIELISQNDTGSPANNSSSSASLSFDGRYITYQSNATNIIDGSPVNSYNIYVFDRISQTTICASLSNSGVIGNASSFVPSISANGQYVLFTSLANNLIPDISGKQIYRRDIINNQTIFINQTPTGTLGNDSPAEIKISPDGMFVTVSSKASNIAENDFNAQKDVFVIDIENNNVTCVSLNPNTAFTAFGTSNNPTISRDGKYIAYSSNAKNLTTDTFLGANDMLFVYNTQTAKTIQLSSGLNINSGIFNTSIDISDDGNYISYSFSSYNDPSAIQLIRVANPFVVFSSPGTLAIELSGNTPGTEHDQVNVTGTVDLTEATLDLTLGYYPSPTGDSFTIINNDDTDAITGTFSGLAEVATFTMSFGGVDFDASISYIGGDGNDVVITTEAYTLNNVYVDDDWASLTFGEDPDGAGPLVGLGYDSFATITEALAAVTSGGTVNVLEGTYVENLTLDQAVQLRGAGSGLTILEGGSAIGIDITAGGISAADADRLLISGMTVNNAASMGIVIDESVSFITIDDVDVNVAGVKRTDYGLEIGANGDVTDLKITNSAFSTNNQGAGMHIHGGVDGLTITDSAFDGNNIGFYAFQVDNSGTVLTNVNISDSSFSDNIYKGLYIEKLSNALIDNISVNNSGTQSGPNALLAGYEVWPIGIDLNLKYYDYTNVTIQNSTITNSGSANPSNGSGFAVKTRNDGGYATHPATLDGLTVTNNFINGAQTSIRIGEPGKGNTGLSNVLINDNDLSGSLTGNFIDNQSVDDIDASSNWFGLTDIATIATGINGSVDFSPILASGTDTQPATAGFQPDHTALIAHASGSQSTGLIQEAVNAIEPNGTMTLDGTINESITVGNGITVKGSFTINGTLTLVDGATLAPGNSPAIVNVGGLVMGSGETLDIELFGTTPGTEHDQVNVTGTVDITDATLNVVLSYLPASTDSFVIINNDGNDAIIGTFAGLAEGDTFTVDGIDFVISYVGGDGNDVVLSLDLSNFNDIYVDDDWASLNIGDDPDGAGPAKAIGLDAFASITEGVAVVNASGTVHIADGSYVENNIAIDKSLSLVGVDSSDVIVSLSSSTGLLVSAGDVSFSGMTLLAGSQAILIDNATSTIANVSVDDMLFINNGSSGIMVQDDTTVQNLSVTDSTFDHSGVGINFSPNAIGIGVTVDNSTFRNQSRGFSQINFSTDGYVTGLSVTHSTFINHSFAAIYGHVLSDVLVDDNTFTENGLGFGYYQSQLPNPAAVDTGDFTITNNTFTDHGNTAIMIQGNTQMALPMTIQNNAINQDVIAFDSGVTLIHVVLADNQVNGKVDILDNVINYSGTLTTTSAANGITLRGGLSEINVLRNTINGGDVGTKPTAGIVSSGILLFGDAGTYGGDKVTITNNVIHGFDSAFTAYNLTNSAYGGLASQTIVTLYKNDLSENVAGIRSGDGGDVNASSNWWGSTDLTSVTALMTGNVDYSPFLASGTDTDLSTPGFQPDMSHLYVHNKGSQINGVILEGLNDVASNGVLTVLPGDYASGFLVSKNMTMEGSFTNAAPININGNSFVLQPGYSDAGSIAVTILQINNGADLQIDLNGTTAGTTYDQLIATQSVNLTDADLDLTLNFLPTSGTSFTLINNEGNDAIVGKFAGLDEGSQLVLTDSTSGIDVTFQISYTGGDGNDVVLSVADSIFDVIYVDDDWASLSNGDDPDAAGPAKGYGFDAFATISDAIAAVNDGGTIYVFDGTYTQALTINKSMTLLGANADVDPTHGGSRNAESTITNNVTILSDDVVFNGFELTGYNYNGLTIGGQVSNVTVSYNYVHGSIGGNSAILLAPDAGSTPAGDVVALTNIDITNNYIVTNSTINNQVGIRFSGPAYTHDVQYNQVTLDSNEITGIGSGHYGIFSGANPAGYSMTDAVITNNYIHDVASGINLGNMYNGLVDGNIIDGTSGTGTSLGVINGSITNNTYLNIGSQLTSGGTAAIGIWGTEYGFTATTNATITGNVIHFNDNALATVSGIYTREGADSYNIHINENSFINGLAGSDAFAVANWSLDAGTLDASNNWWSTTDASEVQALATNSYENETSPGVFETVYSGKVDTSPFLESGTDDSVADGFQGDFAAVTVHMDGSQTVNIIHEGIEVVDVNGTVHVAAGNYDTRTVFVTDDGLSLVDIPYLWINKTVNLLGANNGVNPNTGVRGAESIINGTILIDSSNVLFDGFELTGTVVGTGYTDAVGQLIINNDATHTTLQNLYIHDVDFGTGPYIGHEIVLLGDADFDGGSASNTTIIDSDIEGDIYFYQNSFSSSGTTWSDVLIQNNNLSNGSISSGSKYSDYSLYYTLDNLRILDNQLGSLGLRSLDGVLIDNNTFDAGGASLSGSGTISNNNFNNGSRLTLGLNDDFKQSGTGSVNVTGNIFQFNVDPASNDYAIFVNHFTNASSIHINGNAFENGNADSTTDAVINQTAYGYGILDLSNNWWDTTVVSEIVDLTFNPTFDGFTNYTGLVDTSPFLESGADTDLLTPGFQGDFSALTVHSSGAQTTGLLDEGLASLDPNGTLTVLPGSYSDDLIVPGGSTVAGEFTTTGTVTFLPGSIFSPGYSPAIANTGDLVMTSGSILEIELFGTTPGTEHDQVNVTGTVDITDATLNVTLGYSPTVSDSYVIINNDGSDTITGTFDGLAEGDFVVIGGVTMSISYVGGDGNDVVLTTLATSVPTSVYVDDDWAGLSLGVDPDGAGPATAFGVNAFATIQEAVDAVADNGTVHVYNGLYQEEVTIDHNLLLMGIELDTDGVIIDGQNIYQPLNIVAGTTDVTLQYFTVTNGIDDNIDINDAGTVTINHVKSTNAAEDGIDVEGTDSVSINDSTIDLTTDDGIDTDGVDHVTITNTVITRSGGSGMELYNGFDLTIENSTVDQSTEFGMDIFFVDDTYLTDVTVTNAGYDGIWIENGLLAQLTRVTSQHNVGDGIYITFTQTIELLDSNASYNGYAGLNVEYAQTLTDTNGIYTENEDSGIILSIVLDQTTLTRTTATNNNADFGEYGAGLEIYGDLETPGGYLSGLGGDVLIQGGTFSDTDNTPYLGNVYSQTDGIYIEGIAGSVDIVAHDNGSDIQTTSVRGNDELGVGVYGINGHVNIENADISRNYGHGLDIDQTGDVTVTDSSFIFNNGFGIWMTNVQDIILSGLDVQLNHLGILVTLADTFTDTNSLYANNSYAGMKVNNIDVLNITGTSVIDNGAQAIRLTDINDANLTQLTLTGNDVGVEIQDFIHAFDLTNSFINDNRIGFYVNELYHNFGLTVFDNDLSGNSEYAILNGDTGPANTQRPVGASGNWFGSIDEATIAAMLGGLVDFTPYLATGTDTSPDTGFQGDFSNLYVTTLGEQTTSLVGRLQEAVDLVTSNGIIFMNSGVYNEDVTVNENKILKGTGTVNGTITLVDSAQFLPGTSPGAVTMTNLVGSMGMNYTADIDGTTPATEHDQLIVTGHVTLNGMALISELGYDPAAGDTVTLIDNQGTDAIEGTFADMPEGALITLDGALATITYTGGDGNDVQVIFNGPNTAPVADDVQAVAVEDGSPVTLTFKADDADIDDSTHTLIFQLLSLPREGKVTNNGNGTFTFDPGKAFQDLGVGETRNVTFTYQATDSHGVSSSVQTITITVQGTNDAPVAAPSLVNTQYQTALNIDVLKKVTDIDGDILQVSGIETTPGSSSLVGTSNLGVTININDDGTIHYDPTGLFDSLAPGQTVRDAFRYVVTDPYGLSDRHVVFIDVTRPMMTPVTASSMISSSSTYSSSAPVTASNRVSNSAINHAALAFVSQQAQLHILPATVQSGHWLDTLLGHGGIDQELVEQVEMPAA